MSWTIRGRPFPQPYDLSRTPCRAWATIADMRSPRRSPLHVPVFLCAVALLLARPAAADGGSGGGEADSGVSARVVRLYEDAAAATQRYETVHREAEK